MDVVQRCWCEASDVTLLAQLANLSEGGTFVKTYVPLAEGSTARLRFSVEEAVIEALATVVWCRHGGSADEPPGMGLRFEEMEGQHRDALRSFLSSAVRGNG